MKMGVQIRVSARILSNIKIHPCIINPS